MIDSVTDKGTALSSAQVKGKLKELANSYKSLCQTAQAQVKTAEHQVDLHQSYADNYQQCKDWITMTKDKHAVCSEVSGDKQTLQNRLDRIKVITVKPKPVLSIWLFYIHVHPHINFIPNWQFFFLALCNIADIQSILTKNFSPSVCWIKQAEQF